MGDVARFLFMPVGLGGFGIDLTKERPLEFWTGKDNDTPAPQVVENKTTTETQKTETKKKRASALDKNTEDFNINASNDDTTTKKKTLLGE